MFPGDLLHASLLGHAELRVTMIDENTGVLETEEEERAGAGESPAPMRTEPTHGAGTIAPPAVHRSSRRDAPRSTFSSPAFPRPLPRRALPPRTVRPPGGAESLTALGSWEVIERMSPRPGSRCPHRPSGRDVDGDHALRSPCGAALAARGETLVIRHAEAPGSGARGPRPRLRRRFRRPGEHPPLCDARRRARVRLALRRRGGVRGSVRRGEALHAPQKHPQSLAAASRPCPPTWVSSTK